MVNICQYKTICSVSECVCAYNGLAYIQLHFIEKAVHELSSIYPLPWVTAC